MKWIAGCVGSCQLRLPRGQAAAERMPRDRAILPRVMYASLSRVAAKEVT